MNFLRPKKHRGQYTCLYVIVEWCLMMSGNDEWPFVLWLFVRLAFCPVAFVRVAFCPGAERAYRVARTLAFIHKMSKFTLVQSLCLWNAGGTIVTIKTKEMMTERHSEQWIGLSTLQASRTVRYRADEWKKRIELVAVETRQRTTWHLRMRRNANWQEETSVIEWRCVDRSLTMKGDSWYITVPTTWLKIDA